MSDETAIELAGFAAQVQFGDFNEEEHIAAHYLADCEFMEHQDSTVEALIMERHRVRTKERGGRGGKPQQKIVSLS